MVARLSVTSLLLALSLAACVIAEDHGPVGSVRNDTSEPVVVSYRSSNGNYDSWAMEVSPGQEVLVIVPFQAFARSGCLPGTLVAKHVGRLVAEIQGMCADKTWEITAPVPSVVVPPS